MTRQLTRGGALGALLVLGLGACGGTGGGGGPTAQGSALCQGTPPKPGYADTIPTVSGAAGQLSGAGSTFINPIMSVWAAAYNTTAHVQVAYQSVGSGAGIAQLQAGTVDFGASDAFMTDADIAKAKGPVLQFPMVLAPVAVTYNLSGVSSGLQLDGDTLGKIFAGKITTWNDAAITALNPGKTLPNTPIAVVHRSDGSGTTSIFTSYLVKESPSWVTALGGDPTKARGKTVAWPTGIGGKGSDGVSAAVGQTQGAIGYVELSYAIQQNLSYAYIKNKAGSYIQPCIQTVEADAKGVTFPDDLRFDLTDQADPSAYPITGTTWVLVYQAQSDPAKAAALVNFLAWDLTVGQDSTLGINYTPLSPDLQARDLAQLKKLTLNGAPIVH